MTREEYEQRKRRLEEQLRAGIELVEAAYRKQMRALDLVWMARSEEGVAISPSPAQEASPPAARQEAPRSSAPVAPRRPRKELKEEVRDALDSLPEVFDRNQVCEILGYQPDRSSLFRVLQQFLFQGALAVESYGGGRRTTQYRKTGAGVPLTTGDAAEPGCNIGGRLRPSGERSRNIIAVSPSSRLRVRNIREGFRVAWAAIRNIGEPAHIVCAGSRPALLGPRAECCGTAKGIVPKARKGRGRKWARSCKENRPSISYTRT